MLTIKFRHQSAPKSNTYRNDNSYYFEIAVIAYIQNNLRVKNITHLSKVIDVWDEEFGECMEIQWMVDDNTLINKEKIIKLNYTIDQRKRAKLLRSYKARMEELNQTKADEEIKNRRKRK